MRALGDPVTEALEGLCITVRADLATTAQGGLAIPGLVVMAPDVVLPASPDLAIGAGNVEHSLRRKDSVQAPALADTILPAPMQLFTGLFPMAAKVPSQTNHFRS